MTCCFRNVSPRLQFVRMWSFVGLRVDTTLELTDGRAECLRVAGNTRRRSFAPSAVVPPVRAGTRAACAGGQARLAAACDSKLSESGVTLPGRTGRLCAGPGDRLDPATRRVSRATTRRKARETCGVSVPRRCEISCQCSSPVLCNGGLPEPTIPNWSLSPQHALGRGRGCGRGVCWVHPRWEW